MDAAQIEACIGLTDETPEVKALLAGLGVTKKLKLPAKDDLRLELLKQGLLLVFEPEKAKSSVPKLVNVQYYSDTEHEWTTFAGALPGGLAFGDDPKAARAKLGKPTKIMKDFRLDHWITGDRQLTVRYDKPLTGIAYVMSGYKPK